MGFLEAKTVSENWGTKYRFNCFTYKGGSFTMEPTEKVCSQWEMEKSIFKKFSKNFYGCELPQN